MNKPVQFPIYIVMRNGHIMPPGIHMHRINADATAAKEEGEVVPLFAASPGPSELVEEMEALADDWKKKAHDAVPPEYAARAMHYKYLKGDNYAAGQDDCADDLRALITRHRGKS